MNDELESLQKLRDKLRLFSNYKKQNMIDFMDWAAYPKQDEIMKKILARLKSRKGKKIFVIFGSNRSGKTEAGAGIVSMAMEALPGLKSLCATINYSLSIQVQQSKINKLLRKLSVKYAKFNPMSGFTNQVIYFKNEAKTIFRTYAQGRESVQGMDLDLVWLDEECPWSFFQEILARTADRNGIVVLTFTSLMGFTRLVNFLWETNLDQVESTVLTILDNPFIDEEAKANWIATVDPDEVDSRVYGQPKLKEGLIYKAYSDLNKTERFDYKILVHQNPARWKIHDGIDPHTRTPHHWLRFLYDRKKNVLYVVEELKAPKESMLICDFARLIKLKQEKLSPEFTQIDTSAMTPDVTHKHTEEDQEDVHTIRLEFYNNGINTMLCSKDNSVGINAVKTRLKAVKTITGEVKRPPLLYVFNDLSGVHWEFQRYSWASYSSDKLAEKKEMLNKPNKKNDHYMDIIKYECIKIKNDYGLDADVPENQDNTVLYGEIGY